MSIEYQKVKSVEKSVTVRGPALDQTILDTMKLISDIVGATLGPAGRPVLIERYEHGLSPLVTKDGVTVFRALGLPGAAEQCVMEAARDAAARTAADAGDGTTTATILAEAIVRNLHKYCKNNLRESPQRVMRKLEQTFRDYIEPEIGRLSLKFDTESEDGLRFLHSVATVSANGDTDLADAVMRCFAITGDEGNVTIVERSGPSHYETEQLKGFAIGIGYEESCAKFGPQFINDPGRQMVSMEKPIFLLYHGRITEMQTIAHITEEVGRNWIADGTNPHNLVICAIGFSETVLAYLGATFPLAGCINVFPLVVPHSPQTNGQLAFLQDLSAITGAKVLNPLSDPVESATLADLGPGVEAFECSRFRSTVIGHADEVLLECREAELAQQLLDPESELDAVLLRERKAKLTGGIAKLWVVGSSNGELKEKKDRAEDAVCAVRGAIRSGVLPGGGWTLLKLLSILPRDPVIDAVLRPAFLAPFERLVSNCGIVTSEDYQAILQPILEGIRENKPVVYDFLNQEHVDAYGGGILDSTPAVLEAIRNSLSIAALLGTLGGTVVFKRDRDLERTEARASAQWHRDANVSPADERP
jgi:chaperonin GroEL